MLQGNLKRLRITRAKWPGREPSSRFWGWDEAINKPSVSGTHTNKHSHESVPWETQWSSFKAGTHSGADKLAAEPKGPREGSGVFSSFWDYLKEKAWSRQPGVKFPLWPWMTYQPRAQQEAESSSKEFGWKELLKSVLFRSGSKATLQNQLCFSVLALNGWRSKI